MVSNVGQNRRRYETKQMQAEHTLRALQDQLRCLTELPTKTLEDAKVAAAKGKAFVTQLNNLKKVLIELQPRQDTVPPVFHRLHKQGDSTAAKREQERIQQFCEETKREINALSQQYKSWDKQMKEAREELGGGVSSVISDGTKKSSVLMKSVSKSGCSVASLDSGESSREKLVRSSSSKLVDDDDPLRMVLVRDENKEIVQMVDEERLGGKTGGFREGNCVVEEIDEHLSGRSSFIDMREREGDPRLALEDDRSSLVVMRQTEADQSLALEDAISSLVDLREREEDPRLASEDDRTSLVDMKVREEDQRLALEDGRSSLVDLTEEEEDQRLSPEEDTEKRLITRGHTGSRFKDLIDMRSAEDFASSAILLADESRDLVHFREQNGNVLGLESTNKALESCVSEESVEFPSQQNAESFGLNDHEHGEDESNEERETVVEAPNTRRNSGIQILLADESRDLIQSRGEDGNVIGLESTNGAFESCVSEKFGEFPSQQKMTESSGSNDHEHGEDESDEDCETGLEASNMKRNSGIQFRIRPNDHEHGEDDSNENCEMTLEASNMSRKIGIQVPIRPNDHEQREDESNEDCGIVLDAYNMRNSGIQIPIRPPSRVSKGEDKLGDNHKGFKESTFKNNSSTLKCITESMNPTDKKVMQSDDDGVSSNKAKATVGAPKDNLKGVHVNPKKSILDIQSKLRKWRNELHFDNDESPLPVWALSDLAKSEEEEIENLKECWKLRQENMKVPMKIQCLEDLDRSFLDKQSWHKFHGFLVQTMAKFENKIEDLAALDAAEENIMEVASGVKPRDAMNEIVMMEDLLSHNKMLENSPNSSFKRETMELEGNKLIELEKVIEKAPTFKRFTDVHLLEEKEEDVKPGLKAIRRPQSHVTFDEKVHNCKEKSQWNLKAKDQTLRMNLVQSQKLPHQTTMKEPPDGNPFVKDEAKSVTKCPEQRIEISDTEGIEEAMKRNMKPHTRNSRGLTFNIQNSTNCFFTEPAFSTPAPAFVPGINIIKQSPKFRAIEKRVCKIEEKELKVEQKFGKKTVEKLVQSETKNLHKAQKKEKNPFFLTLVLYTMGILVAFLTSAIYKVEKYPPPT